MVVDPNFVDKRFIRQDLLAVIKKFKEQKILVIGDVMLDEYLFGEAQRLSLEAPIPILLVKNRSYRLGGASNTANNVSTLGGEATLISVIGNDSLGRKFLGMLRESGIRANKIITDNSRPTTIKTRVVAGYKNHAPQQIVRYDEEINKPINAKVEDQLISLIKDSMKRANVIIVSDYDKGVMTERVIKAINESSTGKTIIVDTKPHRFLLYKNFDWFTPNMGEAESAVGMKSNGEPEVLRTIGKKFIKLTNNPEHLLITAGDKGMFLFGTTGDYDHIPALAKDITDVSGAGDTVTAALGLCLSTGANPLISCTIANAAAGVVVKKIGTSSTTSDEVIKILTE